MLRGILYVLLAIVAILAVVLAARFLLNRGGGEEIAGEDTPGLVVENAAVEPSYPVDEAAEGETAVVALPETSVADSAATTEQTTSSTEGETAAESGGDTPTTDDAEVGGGSGDAPLGGDAESADDPDAGGGVMAEEVAETATEDAEVGGGGGEEAAAETTGAASGVGGQVAQAAFVTPGVPAQHMVYQHEWLMQIARCYGTTVRDIRTANHIPIPDRIYPGAVLTIPNPGNAGPITINEEPCFVHHVVQRGENLSQIAQAYGINLHWLARINAVYNYNYIQAGQLLVIPNPVPPELTVAPRR